MVKAGELGGVLEVVLTRLAEYQEKAHKLKNKIVAAMVYPVIVMFIAVAILTFLMLFIVPRFKEMFNDMGSAELPTISKVVFGFSEFMLHRALIVPNAVWIMIGAFGIWFSLQLWARTKGGRRGRTDRETVWRMRAPRGPEREPAARAGTSAESAADVVPDRGSSEGTSTTGSAPRCAAVGA